MITPGSANPLLAAGGEYQISRSLRFNSADSAYLNRTPSSAGNRKTWTWSGWVKLGALGVRRFLFAGGSGTTDTTNNSIEIRSNNDLTFQGGTNQFLITSQLFRDPSARYHIVCAFDSTQATATNRVKLYLSGSQITAFATDARSSITQNTDYGINNNTLHCIGATSYNASPALYFDGYLTEVNFIDGQALTPSSFGETDPITGVWKPKKYTGTYGTNGFYLNFSDNSGTTATTLGKDYSGNGNNWTPNNFSVTAGSGNDSLVDVPTLWGSDTGAGGEVRGNYATLNPLISSTYQTLSNGNLTSKSNTSTDSGAAYSTFSTGLTGKWYMEFVADTSTAGGYPIVGTTLETSNLGNANGAPGIPGQNGGGSCGYRSNGQKYISGTSSSYGNSFATNDVIGVAVDCDNGAVYFSKNGTWQNSGDPTSGATKTGAANTWTGGSTAFYIGVAGYTSGNGAHANFGQHPFQYTAPSGFKALCTTNLPDSAVKKGSDQFNVVLDTGANIKTASEALFPSNYFEWIKDRANANNHQLIDIVRGSTAVLQSNTTAAETTYSAPSGSSVGWVWKANGAGVTNTAGTITSTVSANTTAGFSIVTWTNPTTSNFTVGHGLGVAPRMIITKVRNSTSGWVTYHASLGNTYALTLNTTAAQDNSVSYFNSTSPTSTVFTLGDIGIYGSGVTMVAYCFAAVPGYSAFGSYTGNGSADGPFIYTGFRPRWVMFKQSDAIRNWQIIDALRAGFNGSSNPLLPNTSDAEAGSADRIDFTSNGFKIRTSGADYNASGGTYIFAAFAENPFKYSLAR